MNRTRKNRNSSYALVILTCVAAFVYSFNASMGPTEPVKQTKVADTPSPRTGSRDFNSIDKPIVATASSNSSRYDEPVSAEVSIYDTAIASPFSYSENEIRSELMKSFGSEEPDDEQLNRRHVEKFLSYGRQVSLLAEEQSRLLQIPSSAGKTAQTVNSNNDSAIEIENPYLSLRERGVTREQDKNQEQLPADSKETRSERYVRQAAQSAAKQM